MSVKGMCSKAAGIYFHKYPPAVDIEVDVKTKKKNMGLYFTAVYRSCVK